MSHLRTVISAWVLLALAALAGGCNQDQPALTQGYASLANHQYRNALDSADAQLRRTPSGSSAAEAWYLRGRTLEAWPAATPGAAAANLGGARQAYEMGLACNPEGQLRAYLRASLGNVAFFQDDYLKAEEMSRLAYADLRDQDTRAWTLYRVGLSRQRLGQFASADQIFNDVVREFPASLQARRAAENRGARAFYLRLGAFTSNISAERGADDLRRKGYRGISVWRDARGYYLLRLGPYGTYAQAKAGKAAVASRYPDAIVMP